LSAGAHVSAIAALSNVACKLSDIVAYADPLYWTVPARARRRPRSASTPCGSTGWPESDGIDRPGSRPGGRWGAGQRADLTSAAALRALHDVAEAPGWRCPARVVTGRPLWGIELGL
jgi:hypothetical protein